MNRLKTKKIYQGGKLINIVANHNRIQSGFGATMRLRMVITLFLAGILNQKCFSYKIVPDLF